MAQFTPVLAAERDAGSHERRHYRAYFGGRLLGSEDRLGSRGTYFPYGEDRGSPPPANDKVKFATYTRDSATGLDYADQRYYAASMGRFLTPDPYRASGGPSDPQSWNRYAYVEGDPINHSDRVGLYRDAQDCIDDPDTCEAEDWGDGLGGGVGIPGGNGDEELIQGPEGTGPWYGTRRMANLLLLQGLAAAALNAARSSASSYDYVDHLQLVSDCITMINPKTAAPSRDRTYQAIDENGDPIGAAITERVFVTSGALATTQDSTSTGTGSFTDQMGLAWWQASTVIYYQYFVTGVPGTPWANVPTPVRTASGDFMVFSVAVSGVWANGKKVYNVTYNGDAGMWNPDGTPRLPLCN